MSQNNEEAPEITKSDAESNTQEEENDWRKPASQFLSQAIAGVWMARRRMSEDPDLGCLPLPPKEYLFATYLNNVWRSLIVRDDPVVIGYWDAIHTAMPNESPQCLIHKMFKIGCALLEEPINVECDDINKLRVPVHRICQRRCDEAFALIFDEKHACSGPSYESLAAQDPDDDFFKFSAKEPAS
jgi:hypothetical protein